MKIADNIEISNQHLNYVVELNTSESNIDINKQLDISVDAQFSLNNNDSPTVAKVKHNLICKISQDGILTFSGSGVCQNDINKNFCYAKVKYRHEKDIIKNNIRIYMFELKYGFVNANKSNRKNKGINLNKSIFFTWSPLNSREVRETKLGSKL